MTNKKDLIIMVLAAFCLTAVLFTILPVSSQGIHPYDPWWDLDDDGRIDISDLARVSGAFGTYGTPINKTELLLELQSEIDSLNSSLLNQGACFTLHYILVHLSTD